MPSRKQNTLGAAAQVEQSLEFSNAFFFLIGGPLLVISCVLALHNLRRGSADKTGALRFVVVMAVVDGATALMEAHHNLSVGMEMTTLLSCLVNSVGRSIRFWIYYIALEPQVRRIWPRVLISWNRLINGRLTDPLVGREILIGCLFGAVMAILVQSRLYADGLRQQGLMGNQLWMTEALLGGQGIAVTVGNMLMNSLTNIFSLLVLLVFRIVARRDWLAVILFTAVFTQINTSASDGVMTYVFVVAMQLVNVLVALRIGLLAMMTAQLVQQAFIKFPVTSDLSEWFAPSGLVGLAIALGLAAVAFHISLGGRSLFGDAVADGRDGNAVPVD